MTNSSYLRSALAQAALELIPPMLRKDLLEDPAFREEYGFKTDSILVLGNSGFSIKRSELFDAIRKYLSDASVGEVTSTDGKKWHLKDMNADGVVPIIALSRGSQDLILPDSAVLSPDSNVRLQAIEDASHDVNLPNSSKDSWRVILAERPLEDDELDLYHSDFRNTPVRIAQSIRNEIAGGNSKVSSLVPHSRKYFERLVGIYDGSASIRDYAAGRSRQFFEQLSAWRPYDGFLFSLLLSSHSSLTAKIGVEQIKSEDLVHAYEFLKNSGDRISQLGAIEIGLRVLPERPEMEPVIIHLIEQIRDDDVEELTSGFKLLSALFVLVDGELSRIRLFSAEPPFYRRLASLTQASLIHRQLTSSNIQIDSFCDWAFQNRGEEFIFQSLTDMRLEPRWHPDLGAASQIKADFFGRIMIAAKNYEMNIKGSELHDIIFSTERESLHSLSKFPLPYLPGPLEGVELNTNPLPDDFSEAIQNQIGTEEVGPSSFTALVNSALIYQVDSEQAKSAAEVLKLGSYRLADLIDRSQLLAVLMGLANVAAVARSSELADELRILVRRYRYDGQYALSIQEVTRICLVAAASRADLNDWREVVGDWLTELAFGDLEGENGLILYSHMQCLLNAVPELWISCGRANAALRAHNASWHSN